MSSVKGLWAPDIDLDSVDFLGAQSSVDLEKIISLGHWVVCMLEKNNWYIIKGL